MGELAQQIIPANIYEAYKPILNPDEFMAGYRQAEEGVTHRAGMGEEYDRGYHATKQWEAIKDR